MKYSARKPVTLLVLKKERDHSLLFFKKFIDLPCHFSNITRIFQTVATLSRDFSPFGSRGSGMKVPKG